MNGSFTVDTTAKVQTCGPCKMFSARFTLCNNPQYEWTFGVTFVLGVYKYVVNLGRNCESFIGATWIGTAADCNGCTVTLQAGAALTFNCNLPSHITVSF